MSLLTKHALIVGLLYAAVFEGLLANLPFSVRLVTVIYYTRMIAYRTMGFLSPRSTAAGPRIWQRRPGNSTSKATRNFSLTRKSAHLSPCCSSEV